MNYGSIKLQNIEPIIFYKLLAHNNLLFDALARQKAFKLLPFAIAKNVKIYQFNELND